MRLQDGHGASASTQQAGPYEDSTLASLPLDQCAHGFFVDPLMQRLRPAWQQRRHNAALGRQLRQAVTRLPRTPDGCGGSDLRGCNRAWCGAAQGVLHVLVAAAPSLPVGAAAQHAPTSAPTRLACLLSTLFPYTRPSPCASPALPHRIPPVPPPLAQWRTTTAPAPSASRTCCSCAPSPPQPHCRSSLTSTTTR